MNFLGLMSCGDQIVYGELALIVNSLCKTADETGHGFFIMSSLKRFIGGLVQAGGSTFILCLRQPVCLICKNWAWLGAFFCIGCRSLKLKGTWF